jgi:hypothetical protein
VVPVLLQEPDPDPEPLPLPLPLPDPLPDPDPLPLVDPLTEPDEPLREFDPGVIVLTPFTLLPEREIAPPDIELVFPTE